MAAGSFGTNHGIISLNQGAIVSQIPAGKGQSLQASISVPRNVVGYIPDLWASFRTSAGGNVAGIQITLELAARLGLLSPNPVTFVPFKLKLALDGTSYARHAFPTPLKIHGPSDLQLAVTNTSDDGVEVSGGFSVQYADIGLPSRLRSEGEI